MASYDKTLERWVMLYDACRIDPKLSAFLHSELATLRDTVREARLALGRRTRLELEKEEATLACRAAVAQGKDLSIRIRSGVKSVLGPRNAKLVKFGVAPLRPRGKRARKPGA